MKTVILTTCDNSTEAHLIRGNLASEGIESFLSNENYTSLYPNMSGLIGSGIDIMVAEEDLEHALQIIQK